MIVAGLFLIVLTFFINGDAFWVPLIYGIPLLGIGIFILFNKHEDRIEGIKVKGGKR